MYGRVISAGGSLGSGTYAYGGDDLRVHQVTGSTIVNAVYSGGNVIAEYDNASGVLGEFIYAGGQQLAALGGSSVVNEGFEQGSLNWQFSASTGSVGVVTDGTRAHSGSNYLAVATAAGGWNASVGTQLVSESPGDRVDFGGWLYEESGSGGGDACWLMAALDVNHNGVAYIASSPINATLGTWVYQSGTYTVPANVAYVYLYLEVRNPSSASVIRFDDGFLRTGTVYFHPDHLSTRVLTSANGSVLGQQGHYPFGESWYAQNRTWGTLPVAILSRDVSQ